MPSLRLQAIVLLLLCVCLCRAAQAKTSAYNLTEIHDTNLTAVNQHGGDCHLPGSCTHTNVTVKPNTLLYMCGFDATYKVKYQWESKKTLQTFLIRERVLKKCNISAFDTCALMKATKCSKVTACTKGRHGTVFGGNMCFVIVNNKGSSSWINFVVESTFDKTLAGGRAACVLLTTVVALLVLEPLIKPLLPHMKSALSKRARPEARA